MIPRQLRLRGLSVAQRLALGLAPALLAVVVVIGLAYYGELGREAPGYLVAGAALLAALSLWVTWFNTRYLALRIQRLAGGIRDENAPPEHDELGRIAQVVERLGAALTASETTRRQALEDGAVRLHEQSTMLGATVREALARLDEVRLPLHILHDAPFGELNENQEEMIESARAAADVMDAVLRRLMVCSDVDRDAFPVVLEHVAINDVVRAVLPMLRASSERAGLVLRVELNPVLPKVLADRTRLAEALALFGAMPTHVGPDTVAPRVATGQRDGQVWMRMSPVSLPTEQGALQMMLATRLVSAQGGTVSIVEQGVEVRLPVQRTVRI